MKKIVPILLAMVLALTLCLVGFADAESYDDDPLEETAASTSEAVLEEAEQEQRENVLRNPKKRDV